MKTGDQHLVNRYIDGELGPEEMALFDRRLRSDERLRNRVEELEALSGLYAGLGTEPAPPVTFRRWMGRVRPRKAPEAGTVLARALAAAACILVGVWIGAGLFRTDSTGSQGEILRFVYYAPEAQSVSVLGDFNRWSREIPLRPKGTAGYWLGEIPVEPGEYRYVLVVDGEERSGDPMADYVIDDDFGSKNSVVRIGL